MFCVFQSDSCAHCEGKGRLTGRQRSPDRTSSLYYQSPIWAYSRCEPETVDPPAPDSRRFGMSEIFRRAKKPRHSGFFASCGLIFGKTRLLGWRSSADGPLLCSVSLLTGNFTGNFAKSQLWARQRLQLMASLQGFRCKFPTD